MRIRFTSLHDFLFFFFAYKISFKTLQAYLLFFCKLSHTVSHKFVFFVENYFNFNFVFPAHLVMSRTIETVGHELIWEYMRQRGMKEATSENIFEVRTKFNLKKDQEKNVKAMLTRLRLGQPVLLPNKGFRATVWRYRSKTISPPKAENGDLNEAIPVREPLNADPEPPDFHHSSLFDEDEEAPGARVQKLAYGENYVDSFTTSSASDLDSESGGNIFHNYSSPVYEPIEMEVSPFDI